VLDPTVLSSKNYPHISTVCFSALALKMNPFKRNTYPKPQQSPSAGGQNASTGYSSYLPPSSVPSRHTKDPSTTQPEEHGGSRIPEQLSRHGYQPSYQKANTYGGVIGPSSAYGQASQSQPSWLLANPGNTHPTQPNYLPPYAQPDGRSNHQYNQTQAIKSDHQFGLQENAASNYSVRVQY
jgi:hypothetical protein